MELAGCEWNPSNPELNFVLNLEHNPNEYVRDEAFLDDGADFLSDDEVFEDRRNGHSLWDCMLAQ